MKHHEIEVVKHWKVEDPRDSIQDVIEQKQHQGWELMGAEHVQVTISGHVETWLLFAKEVRTSSLRFADPVPAFDNPEENA